jgi:hypothetical protein
MQLARRLASRMGKHKQWVFANMQKRKSSQKPDAPRLRPLACASYWLLLPARRPRMMSRACPSTIAPRIALSSTVSFPLGPFRPMGNSNSIRCGTGTSRSLQAIVQLGLHPSLALGESMCLTSCGCHRSLVSSPSVLSPHSSTSCLAPTT